MAPAKSPGELMVSAPRLPSFPAGRTIVMPASPAVDTAPTKGSQATPVATPHVAPESEGAHTAGRSPAASSATSMPSLKAASNACRTTSEVVASLTPGEPKIL